MSSSVGGSGSAEASAAAWAASTAAAAEAHAQEEADAAARARDAAPAPQVTPSDGVESSPAAESFWAHDPNRPGQTSNGSSGGQGATSVSAEDAELLRSLGFKVVTDGSGQSHLPSQTGNHEYVQIAPSWNNVPAPDTTGSSPPPPASETPATPTENPPGGVTEVNDAGASGQPDKLTSGLGDQVDNIINKSPTLRQSWAEAKAKGWEIQITDVGKSRADPNHSPPTVFINKGDIHAGGDPNAKLASLLAHEIGHAATEFHPRIEANTRQEYIDRNLAQRLEHEGAAALENARARDEILANGGPDIGIRGGYDPEYIGIYERYKAGEITEAQARSEMAQWMGREPEAGTPGAYVTKSEIYTAELAKEWDAAHD